MCGSTDFLLYAKPGRISYPKCSWIFPINAQFQVHKNPVTTQTKEKALSENKKLESTSINFDGFILDLSNRHLPVLHKVTM